MRDGGPFSDPVLLERAELPGAMAECSAMPDAQRIADF
jgi:hypothetical protein